MSSLNSTSAACSALRRLVGAVHEGGDLPGQDPLGLPPLGVGGGGRVQLLDAGAVEKGEGAQVGADVLVLGPDPVLEELVGRRLATGVEPHRARLRLPHLPAAGQGDQRRREPVGLRPSQPADEVDALGDVAPLVAAAELEPAAVAGRTGARSRRPAGACRRTRCNEMPCSRPSSRARTDSLRIISLTLKCLPTSRRKSVREKLRRATRRCRRCGRPRSSMRSSWARMPARLAASWSSVEQLALLRAGRRDRRSGRCRRPAGRWRRWPPAWRRRRLVSWRRLPTCRLSAVGSKPM